MSSIFERRSRGRGALESCPTCGSADLVAVFDGERTNFLCDSCTACWHTALGWVVSVEPGTCLGCEESDRCRPTFARDR